MLKTDSLVRCIRTVYRCLPRATTVVPLVSGFFVWLPVEFFCTTQQQLYQAVPANHVDTGDHTQEPNMEGQETVAPIAAEPRLEDKKVEDDPVVEPVVSGLSAIGLEPSVNINAS